MMPILTTIKFSWYGTEIRIGVTRAFGIGNWDRNSRRVWEILARGGGSYGKVSHSSSICFPPYPSFSLTPVEYYCNEPFTLPNWVNSGNNDAHKLCKQFASSSARRVVLVAAVVMMVMMTGWKMRERETENMSSCLHCCVNLFLYGPCKNRIKMRQKRS